MNKKKYTDKITCAYLYTITRYGYPPDARHTFAHIDEMAGLGFSSIELEGIGGENIRYLHAHKKQLAGKLKENGMRLPVFCVVLPQLGSADKTKRAAALKLFEMGCEIAAELGAEGVLDNGPLPPFQYPPDMPVMRHYTENELMGFSFPTGFRWKGYWNDLAATFREACQVAASYGLLYHLHPCAGSLTAGTDAFLNFYDAVECENLAFNLDTANQFFLKDNLSLSVLRLADKIRYIHISDNSGLRLEHLVPGEGNIQWNRFFSTLKEAGFRGDFAIDVGGAESEIGDLDTAYVRTAQWLSEQLSNYSFTG